MPDLGTSLHLDMLREAYDADQPTKDGLYGLHWGDPESTPMLAGFCDRFITPFVGPDTVACEIGPGGGRWTRYLNGCMTLYAVDYHQELLDELAKTFSGPNIKPIKNSGSDFPGIPAGRVDFLFSFGVFVHLETDVIASYIENAKPILKSGGNAVIQYSDKTKIAAKRNKAFSHNTPEIMRSIILDQGFEIADEDTTSLNHSAVVRFRRPSDSP